MNRKIQHTPRILFAGGGTGGHVYPAIAIADAVRAMEPDATIEFAGTRERLEWVAVPKAGYKISAITVSGFQRSMSARNLTFPVKLVKGLIESWSLVGSFDPDVVVGTGGYVSGPVLWTASLRGRPTLIQEQNAYAGVTNRLLGRKATRIHIAFSQAKQYFPARRCALTGNPVRASLGHADRAEARRFFEIPDTADVLFVFGGSMGSVPLNRCMESALADVLKTDGRYVVWQTGRRHFQALADRISHERLRLVAYVDRMDYAYAASDLVLSRAGAITCSELMVTGTPAILVPSLAVAEDHQTKNALALVEQGAAVHLPETEVDRLTPEIDTLFADQARLAQMRSALAKLARPDAAHEIARDVLALAGSPRLPVGAEKA